ncbi:ABC transporter substrate-binding protein [Halorubellus sp. JP-L1]|uniref:ABC transporter substrate-binding protein n=1 Tax=Halorubellus sp. JP-L1 TaxID=2715753 RepID=UPI001407FB55|nr:ABC transporter substrate-binding protein [Halorubellus sp. JP-L1]NHN43117.1 ABC transporter substrate-binding protein [Halorubellus sp. JP-L1]
MQNAAGSATVGRRELLGALGTSTLAASAGCTRRLRSIAGWQSRSQISLSIATLPDDADPFALRAARQIAEWFRAAGIDATVTPMAREELHRRTLLDHDYDAFVGRIAPEVVRPNSMYALVHSKYADVAGWQNPFGYANLDVDDGLDEQRRVTGDDRVEVVADVQETVARTQPFTTLAKPDDVRAVRTSRFENWSADVLSNPLGYLALDRAADAPSDESTLRVVAADHRVTENLNPLAVEYRGFGYVMDLLYDSLGYVTEAGTVQPWLADAWDVSATADAPTARVSLRDDLSWHDGESLTATDVAFTYALLADTSVGANGDGDGDDGTRTVRTSMDGDDGNVVPAPVFAERSSLVADVDVVDEQTVDVQFVEATSSVAMHALTIPVLPEHVWADRTGRSSVSGIEFGPTTEALVTDNVPPVGSGAFEYVDSTPRETLVLERYDDHFLERGTDPDVDGVAAYRPAFDRVRIDVVGTDDTAVSLVKDDEADVTGTPVGAGLVPDIGRSDDLDLLVSRSNAPYVVGYNVRGPPLSNPRFRNTLAHLVDQTALVDQTFRGYAEPAVTPLTASRWVPESLAFDGENPVTPFLGSDGDLDVRRARAAFRDAGFQYDDGKLVRTT